jgi:hypothetical protein
MLAIFDLDKALVSLLHRDKYVNDAVGVLMLTNSEFRAMITQSARHIPEVATKTLNLDLGIGALLVPAVMGYIQEFPVEFPALYPGEEARAGIIAVPYPQLMFACLKACVRSTFLETSLDSLPLFKAVTNMRPVVHMG